MLLCVCRQSSKQFEFRTHAPLLVVRSQSDQSYQNLEGNYVPVCSPHRLSDSPKLLAYSAIVEGGRGSGPGWRETSDPGFVLKVQMHPVERRQFCDFPNPGN